jgi:sigma-B regulation protein RsbU (phosphoserine phosphatase)
MKILIAEDDLTSRQILEIMLAKWGYEVVVACDGNEAWQAFQTHDPPPLAILDWMMPGMDGVEVCRKVRESGTPPIVYIIVLTAKDRKEDIVSALGAGANDYVLKPFERQELLARIQVGERMVKLQSALAERVEELQEALSQIKTLHGVLPICMHCHKIRDDQDAWQKLEQYVTQHSDAQFSHGLCPECMEKYYPDTDDDVNHEGTIS